MLPARHGTAGKTFCQSVWWALVNAVEKWFHEVSLQWLVHAKGLIRTSCLHSKQTILP